MATAHRTTPSHCTPWCAGSPSPGLQRFGALAPAKAFHGQGACPRVSKRTSGRLGASGTASRVGRRLEPDAQLDSQRARYPPARRMRQVAASPPQGPKVGLAEGATRRPTGQPAARNSSAQRMRQVAASPPQGPKVGLAEGATRRPTGQPAARNSSAQRMRQVAASPVQSSSPDAERLRPGVPGLPGGAVVAARMSPSCISCQTERFRSVISRIIDSGSLPIIVFI